MDPFSHLIPDARAFLSELAANNTRDWFTAQKTRYETGLKTPATHLLDQLAHDIGRETGRTLTPKLFRPHRDVRFSKDKTPYHTHLHMLWTLDTPGRQSPGFFFGISPDNVSLGGGVMGFDKPVLTDWRQAVDGAFADRLKARINHAAAHGFHPRDPELKRVPAPFDKDHPHGDLLRRKGLVLWRALDPSEYGTPLNALKTGFTQLSPVLEELQTIL